MPITEQQVRQNILRFFNLPAGQKLLKDEFDLSGIFVVVMILIFWPIALVLGLARILTLVNAAEGWETVKGCFTPRTWLVTRNPVLDDPGLLHPILACGIIVGPKGHGLILGSFDFPSDEQQRFLMRKSLELGNLYTHGPRHAGEVALYEDLRNDMYHHRRRRPVPEPFAEGHYLMMFDVRIDLREGVQTSSGAMLYLFVTDTDKTDELGTMLQLPAGVLTSAPWLMGAPGFAPGPWATQSQPSEQRWS